MLVGDVVGINAYRFPNKEAIIDIAENRRLTWQELNRRVNRLANALTGTGLRKGDKVAVLVLNSFRYVEIYLANAKIGAITVPLNNRLSANELKYIINDSEACAIIVDKAFIQLIKEMEGHLDRIKWFIGIRHNEFPYEYENLIEENSDIEPSSRIDEDDIYAIPYTSGTTGFPKGCLVTQKNVVMAALLHQPDYALTPYDKYLTVLPLFFTVSTSVFLTPAIGGACVLIMTFEPGKVLEVMENESITGTIMVPTMIKRLIEHPDISKYSFKSLRIFTFAASPMPVSDLKRAISIFGNIFMHSYGSTETSTGGTILRPEFMVLEGPMSKRLSSIGKPYVGQKIKVVDKDQKEIEWGSDQVGEIIIKSDTVMKGYWKQPEETAKVFRDGWFSTGDLAKVDEEGFIYIVDRKTDMIISGGINVYPKEIETLIQSFDEVDQVAVLGVPDKKWGEAIKAVVTLKPGMILSKDEIMEQCKTGLASYKKPNSIDIVDEIPVSATGKILKKVLKEKYWRGHEKRVN